MISSRGIKVTTDYTLERRQTGKESAVYFVLEHQPQRCSAYPTNGEVTFANISVYVDNKLVENPEWKAVDYRPACKSHTEIVDSKTIKMTWDSTASTDGYQEGPLKW